MRLYIRILSLCTYLLSQIRQQDAATTEVLRKIRLRKVLKAALKTAWWPRYFHLHSVDVAKVGSPRDLVCIPPLTREHFIKVPSLDLLAHTINNERVTLNRTSGSTTGTPFGWMYANETLMISASAFHLRTFMDYGLKFLDMSDMNFLMYVNYSGGTGGTSRWLGQFAQAVYIGKRNIRADLDALILKMRNAEGGILRSNPSKLFHLMQMLRQYGYITPTLSLCSIMGQHFEERRRVETESFFRCPVVAGYATQELLLVASGCRDNMNLYHIQPERVVVEILRDNGDPVKGEEWGNITVTCLDNVLMPLIRYQPGDRGRLIRKETDCSCENKSLLLEIGERVTDIVAFSDGTTKSIKPILEVMKQSPFFENVLRYQIIQRKLNTLLLLLEFRNTEVAEHLIRLSDSTIRKRYGKKLQLTVKRAVKPLISSGTKFNKFVPLKSASVPTASGKKFLEVGIK